MQPKTGQELIEEFEKYRDDMTELSTDQELALANKIIGEILSDRPWEFLRTAGSVAMTNGEGTLPTDFLYFMPNFAEDYPYNQANRVVVYGANGEMFEVIAMGARNNYGNDNGKMYVDLKNRKLKNTGTYTGTVTFDYQPLPDDIGLTDEPVIPGQFHMMIVHGMTVDDDFIQMSEKARSYAPENRAKFDEYKRRLIRYDNKLQNV